MLSFSPSANWLAVSSFLRESASVSFRLRTARRSTGAPNPRALPDKCRVQAPRQVRGCNVYLLGPKGWSKLANDRAIGGVIFGGSILGIVIYGALLYYWSLETLEVTAFAAVAVLLGILAWIGYTMATTPPPEPITEIPPPPSAKQQTPAS